MVSHTGKLNRYNDHKEEGTLRAKYGLFSELYNFMLYCSIGYVLYIFKKCVYVSRIFFMILTCKNGMFCKVET